jgi:hypothetical protein
MRSELDPTNQRAGINIRDRFDSISTNQRAVRHQLDLVLIFEMEILDPSLNTEHKSNINNLQRERERGDNTVGCKATQTFSTKTRSHSPTNAKIGACQRQTD